MNLNLSLKAFFLGLMYYLGAFIGVYVMALDGQVSLLWPPNAFLLAALLMSKAKHWSYFILAVFCAELTADLPVFSLKASILFGLVNITECLLIAGIVRKFINTKDLIAWNHPQKVVLFIVLILLVATPLAALAGAAVNYYVEGVEKAFITLWRLWWLGDACGLLVLTPICLSLIYLIQSKNCSIVTVKNNLNFLWVGVFSLSLWLLLFGFSSSDSHSFAFAPLLIVLPIIWDMFKLSGPQKVVIAALMALLAVLMTVFHLSPFYQGDIDTTVLLTQEFILIFISIVYLVSAYHTQAIEEAGKLKLFQSAFESVREGLVITEANDDQKIVYCNPAFEHMSGYSKSEIIGRNCRFLNRNHRDQASLKYIKDAISMRQSYQTVILNASKQGKEFWNSLSITPIRDAKGQVTHYSGVQLDVTEKLSAAKTMEQQVLDRTQALTLTQERLEMATAVSGLGIWDWDLATDALVWDDQMHAIYETPDDVLENGLFYEFWTQSLHPDDKEEAAASLGAAIEAKQTWDYEFRLQLPDGRIKHIKATAAVKLDEEGNPLRVIGGNMDITNQRLLEKELTKLVEETKKASRAKSEFLANMSHEIRTSMNGVLGMAELMKNTNLDNRQKDYVGMIESSAKSLLLLLNDILDLSKIEAGQLSLDPIPTSLDESVGDILKGFAVTAHKKELGLHYYIHPNTPQYITVDRLRLGQIMFNLVGNAIKFTNEGEVFVEVSSTDAHLVSVNDEFNLRILVKDTGIGIKPDKQATIFKPFQQADSSVTRKFGGTGLGLPIVVHLVELMGGKLTMSSELGHGTEIELVLPVKRCHDSDLLTQPTYNPSSLDFSKLRILAVDDNAINLRWLNDMAESWGARIDTASSVQDGLKILAQCEADKNPISILLTDKNMPDKSGFDLVESIQKQGLKKPAIIIMLSSSELEDDIKTATALGIEEFILKPVKQSEVFNAIQGALETKDKPKKSQQLVSQQKALKPLDILVAEDNLVNQRVVKDILEPRGHNIHLVENGVLAVAQVEKHFYDVILMDIQMPEMDGIEATKRIRHLQNRLLNQSRIIGVTAHALKGDQELGIQAGMDGYITKPVFAEQLIKAIERTIYDEALMASNPNESSSGALFDETKALAVTGHDKTLLAKMCRMTLDNLPGMIDDVSKSVSNETSKELKTNVHKLTGMVANVCSPTLVKDLRFLEESINEEVSPSNAENWLKLKEHLLTFKKQLEVFLAEVE